MKGESLQTFGIEVVRSDSVLVLLRLEGSEPKGCIGNACDEFGVVHAEAGDGMGSTPHRVVLMLITKIQLV